MESLLNRLSYFTGNIKNRTLEQDQVTWVREAENTSTRNERKHFHMCIKDSPGIAHREEVVRGILNRVLNLRVVLVRGTPASGKTILFRLLKESIAQEYPDWSIYSIPSGFCNQSKENSRNYISMEDHEITEKVLKTFGYDPLEEPPSKQTFLLVDESQTSHKGDWFWNCFIKSVNDGGIMIFVVLFSCYGSATGEALGNTDLTPMSFESNQLIELQWRGVNIKPIGLLLKQEEAEDILKRRCRIEPYPFKISTELMHLMYGLTGGHVGALCGLYEVIKMNEVFYSQSRYDAMFEVNVSNFNEQFLETPEAKNLRASLFTKPFNRGLPSRKTLSASPLITDILREMVILGECTEEDISQQLKSSDYTITQISEGLELLWKSGWVHRSKKTVNSSEVEIFLLPSKIHLWYYQEFLIRKSDTPHQFIAPIDLLKAIITGFQPSRLHNPPRRITATDELEAGRLVEDIYCYEVYRSALQNLSGDFNMSPQFGTRGVPGLGVVDFYFAELRWALELVKEGTRAKLVEHCGRFLPGGKYFSWRQAGHVQDYLVVDFRTTPPRESYSDLPNLVFVIVENNYNTVRILNQHLHEIMPTHHLLEGFNKY